MEKTTSVTYELNSADIKSALIDYIDRRSGYSRELLSNLIFTLHEDDTASVAIPPIKSTVTDSN